MAYGTTATLTEIEQLKKHSLRQLALASEVSRETAARAVRGQRITKGNLRALLDAAARLDARPLATALAPLEAKHG